MDNKINWCMPKKFSKEPTEQVEAKAVSNLLQIDRLQEEPSWQEKHISLPPRDKNRTYSVFRISQPVQQHRTAKNCLKHRNFLSNQRPPQDKVADSPQEDDQSTKEEAPKGIHDHWPEGELWSTQVNWMAESSRREHSQLPPHRRRPNAFQNHGKAARERGSRYDNPERTLSKQLKNNLAFHLSRERQNYHSREEAPLTHRTTNYPSQDHLPKTTKHGRLKGSIQEFMREAFERIYEKNHEEQAAPHKQSEQEKSTIVRKLLQNLESIRDQAPLKNNQRIGRNSYRQRITDQRREASKGVPQLPLPLERPALRKEQHSILNLNEQAEKVYQNRSINQFTTNKSLSPIKPQ